MSNVNPIYLTEEYKKVLGAIGQRIAFGRRLSNSYKNFGFKKIGRVELEKLKKQYPDINSFKFMYNDLVSRGVAPRITENQLQQLFNRNNAVSRATGNLKAAWNRDLSETKNDMVGLGKGVLHAGKTVGKAGVGVGKAALAGTALVGGVGTLAAADAIIN